MFDSTTEEMLVFMAFGRYEVTWGHTGVFLQQQQRKMFHRNSETFRQNLPEKCGTNSEKHRKEKEAQVRDFFFK